MPYSFLPIPKGFQRLDPFPLDSTFVFETLQELKDYASSTNNTAYIGQICTVISDESLYLIKQDRTLKKLNEDTSIFSFISSNSSEWVYQGSDIHALTGYWDSVYTTVKENSSLNWNYQGTDIKSLTSQWIGGNIAYTNLASNSSAYLTAVNLSFLSVSGDWNSAYTTVHDNSSNIWNYQGTDLKNLSSDWIGGNAAYTNLVSNSAAYLSSVDLSFLSVSSNWNKVYTDVSNASSDWNSVYSNVLSNSGDWNYQGTDIKSLTSNWESVYTDVVNASSDWNSVYSNVLSNSGDWNYQGTDIKSLTSNWESVYTDVTNTSGNWNSVYSNFNQNSSTYTTYNYVDNNFLPVSGGSVSGSLEVGSGVISTLYVENQKVGINTETPNESLTVFGNISATGNLYANGYNKPNWDSVYTTVNSNSASFLSTSSDIQEFFDDFITIGASSTLPNALLKQINSGGSIFIVPEDGKQGILTVGTNNLMISNQRGSATSNETIHLGQGDEYRLIFSARRGDNSFNNSLSGRFDMGFHDMLGTNNSYADDGCYFSSENGETWKTNTKTGTSSLIVTDTGIPCDDTWRTFEIHVNSDGTIVNFYIDNILVSTHTQSIPNSSGTYTAIGYRAFRYTNDPVNLEIRLDWQKIIIKRQSNLWE
jgi:hypothetical protein